MATASSKEGHRTQDTGVWNFFWNLIPRDNSANNNGNGGNNNNNGGGGTSTSNHHPSGNTPSKPVTTKRDSHKQQTHRSRRVVVKRGLSRVAAVALQECGFEPCRFVSSLLLCLWDNIAGPKVEQVWVGSETLKEELQLYTARHTLCGVVGQPEQDPAKIETKFHVNSEQGLYKLVLKMQATLNKNQESMMDKFTKELGRFCENMEVLFDVQDCAGLSSTPTSSRPCTNPEHPHHPIHAQSSPPSNIARPSASPTFSPSSLSPSPSFTMSPSPSFNMSPSPSSFNLSDRAREPYARLKDTLFFAPPVHDDFLIKAITSHLQTHGSTVVTGPNVESVNMFVETLAMFLGPSAKDRKRVGLADPKREYTADLLLQGIVGHGVKLIDESVLPNMLPTTWIDLEHHSIKQTPPFHEYGLLRKHFGDFELGHFIEEPDLPATQSLHDLLKDGLFKPPKPEILASPLVHRIISEIYRLPPSLREACISQGFRLLLRKATVMIKYVEAELNKRNTPEELGEEVRTRVQENLGLTKGDFAVLLGLAEKLKPKFYVTLVGDPSVIQEKISVELVSTKTRGFPWGPGNDGTIMESTKVVSPRARPRRERVLKSRK